MRPAPIWTADGPLSPGHPQVRSVLGPRQRSRPDGRRFTPATVGIPRRATQRTVFSPRSGGGFRPTIKAFNIERAAFDFLITVIFDRLFERFPNMRFASVENGSEFLPHLFKKLRSTATKSPRYFGEDPVQTFKQHIWMNPFWEGRSLRGRRLDGCRPRHLRL
jgi:hypothetical protein